MVETVTILIKLVIAALLMYLAIEVECFLEKNVVTEISSNRLDALILSTIAAVDVLGIYFIVQFVILVRPFFR